MEKGKKNELEYPSSSQRSSVRIYVEQIYSTPCDSAKGVEVQKPVSYFR
jgi:hypothetical protein